MKRLFFYLVFLFSVGFLTAQKPSLTKAYNLYYEKDFEKAKTAIDLCIADEKMQSKAQTWLYKGNIYLWLSNQEYAEKQQNGTYEIRYPDAPEQAFDAFAKAKELNRKIESYEMFPPDTGMAKLYVLLYIQGVDLLVNKDYTRAEQVFAKAVRGYEMGVPEHPLKGELYYYYAYTLEMLQRPEEATSLYEKAIADGSTNPQVYIRLIEYQKQHQPSAVPALLTAAKKAAPSHPHIFVAEADYYWDIDKEKAIDLLDHLPQEVYKDPDALVNAANIYIKADNYTRAEILLKKANALNPNHFVIVYNLGYCYLKLYEDTRNEIGDLAAKGKFENINELKNKSNGYLSSAEMYFEKAWQMEPNDLKLMEQLREIYARGYSPKLEDMQKRINEIKNK
ncbi:MAG: hypothetical protein LBR51_08060 [Bacteroidales bacterium]|jgi:tetratricopeptide (TPR) repeat protein|nr:hypothetical protein [Bacteroidales bacterium]